jgi:hypothetical protein
MNKSINQSTNQPINQLKDGRTERQMHVVYHINVLKYTLYDNINPFDATDINDINKLKILIYEMEAVNQISNQPIKQKWWRPWYAFTVDACPDTTIAIICNIACGTLSTTVSTMNPR